MVWVGEKKAAQWTVRPSRHPLILLRNGGQVRVNLLLAEYVEVGLVLRHDGHLDLSGLEVGGQDGGQTVDGRLDGLLVVQVALLLDLLLEEAVGLGLLGAHAARLQYLVY